MKKNLLAFGILVLVLMGYLSVNPPEKESEPMIATAPVKPANVPAGSFWAGGADGGFFIAIAPDKAKNDTIVAQIYNDFSGDLEFSGLLKYSGPLPMPENITAPESILGWDGENLHLKNGHFLEVVQVTDDSYPALLNKPGN